MNPASLAYFDTRAGQPLLEQLLYTDIKTYLVELLMKQDQMSMAASIESRVPFLDHPLVEFTARLPERLKLRGLTTKYILGNATAEERATLVHARLAGLRVADAMVTEITQILAVRSEALAELEQRMAALGR